MFNDNFELVQDLKQLYQRSYVEYLTELQVLFSFLITVYQLQCNSGMDSGQQGGARH